MRLITKQKKPVILEKDLIVYKQMEVVNGEVRSYYMNFSWTLNVLYKTEIELSRDCTWADGIVGNYYGFENLTCREDLESYIHENFVIFSEGYHFYQTIKRFESYKPEHIFKCTIPKGSEVYYDETGLGIANQIIINKEIE
jgi:hypothetical protein